VSEPEQGPGPELEPAPGQGLEPRISRWLLMGEERSVIT